MILIDVDFDEWQCNTRWSYSKKVIRKATQNPLLLKGSTRRDVCIVET